MPKWLQYVAHREKNAVSVYLGVLYYLLYRAI